MSTAATGQPKHTNRLTRETSPYLLQHAHNPVDWYAWGPEAFEAARSQNKPIFLSVGYSTCYWCHVMERQCFENEAIAAVMNESCINVKVDREERPDVDQLYMNFVQVLTRSGGWPMSVFLTPDLRPIFGGTYFPPEDAYGRSGFPKIVKSVAEAYREKLSEMEPTLQQYVGVLQHMAQPRVPTSPITVDAGWVAGLVERSTRDFDRHFGGFGSAPKFPRETLLELLLVQNRMHPNEKQMRMLLITLDALAHGGIRDHLGGGFHRYSTDAKWLVPHFEIMLYDNAMLGWIYTEAFDQTGDTRYATVAQELFDFILREMTSPEGGFYTAFDAEVDGQEGLNYLWTKQEVVDTLKQELGEGSALPGIEWFCRVYGLDEGPNFADPHHGTGKPDKNILYLAEPDIDASTLPSGETAALREVNLRLMRGILYEARRKRKQPLLDTKILTSWNALMIRALVHGGKVLKEPRYLEAATKATRFLLDHHVQPDKSLYRTSRDGQAKYDAFLDDYAFLVRALLDLHAAGGHEHWKDEANGFANQMVDRFGDREQGGFYFTAEGAADLIVRQQVGTDSPLPSGNAVAAIVMLELGQPDFSRAVLAAFAKGMDDQAEGMSAMVEAAARYLAGNEPFIVSPGAEADRREVMTPHERAAEVVEVQGAWATPTELRIKLLIADTFHLQAHDAGKGFIATELRISGESAANVAGVEYPAGSRQSFPFADEMLAVYDHEAEIIVRFHSVMRPGEPVRLALIYQPCNETSCLPPVTKQLQIAAP